MLAKIKPVPELSNVTADVFRNDIYPARQPVLMRGLVSDWESVKAAQESNASLVRYLKRLDNQSSVQIQFGDPGFNGKLFYDQNMTGVNFQRERLPLGTALDRILCGDGGPYYIASTPADQIVPHFPENNRLSFLSPDIQPRLWINNPVTVRTHFDLSQNIACVVSGRRTVTLFPPEQTSNIYMGPLDHTPSGVPVSLVDPEDIDHNRFPRFRTAMEHALVAELEPGDALFIPYFWWHHVRSTEQFNLLVNYWWNEYEAFGSPMDAFLLGLLTVRDLPPSMKEPWKILFDTHVFSNDQTASQHIPSHARGALGPLSWPARTNLWQSLSRNIANLANLMLRDRR